MRAKAKRQEHEERLVEVLAATYGFTLPLRGGQRMAVRQIDQGKITAILDAGFEPTNMTMQYEASQGALSDLMTEHRELKEALEALAEEWRQHGFGVQSGAKYAEQLMQAVHREP